MWYLLKRLFLIAFMEDREFRTIVREMVDSAEKEIVNHPVNAMDALVAVQQRRIGQLEALLSQCLSDYKGLHAMHASTYADRRFEELSNAIKTLDHS